ncbi:MAG: ComEA family DNA-binding protein, partial [Anaerobacillus sp.]
FNHEGFESEVVEENTELAEQNDDEKPLKNEMEFVMVDVKGAVKAPGVYEIEGSGRVKDVIARAGGFLKEADQTQLNLASKVADEMVIYVPIIGENSSEPLGSLPAESNFISINRADLTQLQELPGIGPSKAEAIIQYREENGGFTTIEDLQNISGIGEKTFEKLKDLITVD